ncbi:MAG: metallophosphoesterase family protein, partial [Bacilli bacterium]
DAQLKKGNIVLYGHTHRPQMAWADGVLVLNPGSLSFPKEGYPHTYILMDEKEVQLRDLAGRTLEIRSL